MSDDNINRIDIKEFKDIGFLQEVNRQFLHPLGLALEAQEREDGSYTLGGVQDYRHDIEGMAFADNVIDPVKADNVRRERYRHVEARINLLGSVIQAIPLRLWGKDPTDFDTEEERPVNTLKVKRVQGLDTEGW